MSKRRYFCEQLAAWLCSSEWHFTTLLAICIEVVDGLPDDVDKLIHQLLSQFTEKPDKSSLTEFLISHPIVSSWLGITYPAPRIVKINLQSEDLKPLPKALPQLHSLSDLSDWLSLSNGQIDWLADLKRPTERTPKHFQHFHYLTSIKRDGRPRLIECPKSLLKKVQRKINEEILCHANIHDSAHGFRPNRSCSTHAGLHVQKSHLLLFDIAHYFHSILWSQVVRVFHELGYSRTVAKYLTAFCTHRCDLKHIVFNQFTQQDQDLFKHRHLPQGSPTSPMLSNAVSFVLDKRLSGLAQKLELTYSRYADDLAFSGNNQRDWTFLEPLIGSICLEQGFQLNHKKTRILRSHKQQRVTGITVNEKINVDRRYYDQLKATLNNCVNKGLDSQNREDHSDFRAHLLGRINYVASLNPQKSKKLLAIYHQISD